MINRVVLVGNLSRDPQFSKTQSGISFARFSVAVNRKYGDKEEVAFINCVAWRGAADYIGQYAKKGTTVALEGHITTGSYDDKTTGKKVYTTDVTADNVQIVNGQGATKSQQQSSSKQDDNIYGDQSMKHNTSSDDELPNFDTGPLLDIQSDDLPF